MIAQCSPIGVLRFLCNFIMNPARIDIDTRCRDRDKLVDPFLYVRRQSIGQASRGGSWDGRMRQ